MNRIRIRTTIYAPLVTADQGYVDGTTLSTTSPIQMGNSTTSKSAFIRFPYIFIPRGATIRSSYIRFIAGTTQTTTNCILTIYGSKEGNAIAPTSQATYTAKTVTTKSVNWKNLPTWTASNFTYSTPDISGIIQEVIDGSSWGMGNAILILIKDNSSSTSAVRNFISTQDATSGSYAMPELVVEWGIPSSPVNDAPFSGESLSWVRTMGAISYGQRHIVSSQSNPTLATSGNTGSLSGLYRYATSLLLCNPITGEFIETSPTDISSIFTHQDTVNITVSFDASFIYSGYRIYRTKANQSTLYLLDTVIDPKSSVYIDSFDDTVLDTNTVLPTSDPTVIPFLWRTIGFPVYKNEFYPKAYNLSTSDTTVTSGRVVFLHDIIPTSNGFIQINDTGGTYRRIFNSNGLYSKSLDVIPVTTKMNTTIGSAIAHGYEARSTDGLIPIVKSITSSSGYTVPNGKNFILTGVGLDETESITEGNYSNTVATSTTTSISLPYTNSMLVDVGAIADQASLTANGGQTQLAMITGTGNRPSFGMSYQAVAAAGVSSMGWSGTAGSWAESIVALRPNGTITLDGTSTKSNSTNGTPATSLTISSVPVASNSNRIMLVGIVVRGQNGSSIGVKSVTFGSQNLTLVRHDNNYGVRTEIWALIAPTVTTANVVVTIQSITEIAACATVFFNCQQELNNVTLDVKLTSTSTQTPVIALNPSYGSAFHGQRYQPVPEYMIFKEGNQLLPSATTSAGAVTASVTTGVTIWGYEYYRNL